MFRRLSSASRSITRQHVIPSCLSDGVLTTYISRSPVVSLRLFRFNPLQRTLTMAAVAEVKVPATGKTIKVPTGLFINNQFVPSVDSKETIECVP